MKRLIALILLGMSILISSQAQHPVLYGASSGGAVGGNIFRYDEKDNELKNVYRIKNSGVFTKSSYMVAGKDGVIYGVAPGGPHEAGIIYSIDPATNKYTIRKSFHGYGFNDGGNPTSALVQGKDGKLYGTAGSAGGTRQGGVIYSFDPVSSNYEKLFFLDDVNAFSPQALSVASNGLLYGFAFQSPENPWEDNLEFLFSFDPVSKKFEKLVYSDFSQFFRARPVIEGLPGILYGLTQSTLYSYSLSSNQLTKLADLGSSTGLILGSDGLLYTTSLGTIYSFDPKNNILKVIHDFGQFGDYPLGGLAEGADGKLYGMVLTYTNQRGSIFYSIDKNGDNFKVLRDFEHKITASSLVYAGDPSEGNLIRVNHKIYGFALAERTNPYQYIFSYESSQDLYQKVFRTNLDKGFSPDGSMVQAGDGRFYGMTNGGGGFGDGGLYSFNPGTRKYTMLISFKNHPISDQSKNELAVAGNGKIYGVADYSQSIFSYDPIKSRYTIEKRFENSSMMPFTIGKDGLLYSTIIKDSPLGSGLPIFIFSYNPVTGNYIEGPKLCCGRARIFTASSDGKLYASGETGIYSFDPATNKLEYILYPQELSGFSIYQFSEKLIEASDHKLYGMISDAGTNGKGFIYSFDPSDRSFATIYLFDDKTGPYYSGSLLNASDGKLYGFTGSSLFSLDPLTRSFNLLAKFNFFTGGAPSSGQLVELNTSIPPIVSITDNKMFEGETAKLTVSLNRIGMEAVTLSYRTVAGTANDGTEHPDYVPASGQVMIPSGEISTTISIPLLEDELMETRETFTVVLQKANDANIQLGDSVGIINIKNGSVPIIPPGGEIITIASMLSSATDTVVKDELLIRVAPNPSSDLFLLHTPDSKSDRLSVTVTNLSGQIMDKFDGALKNAQLVFGQGYPAGSYFVRVVDGKKTRAIKLIKTSK